VAGKKERQRKLARERYQRRLSRQAHRTRRAQQWTITGGIAVVVIALAVGGVLFASRSSGTASTARHCSYAASGTAARNVTRPPSTTDTSVSYTATVKTNRGSIVINLLNSKAPCTVNSFVSLAGQKYFNNTICHRLTTASSLSVLQCGDPTGTGRGTPGYKFNDENLKGATYKAGTVAMANGGPNTNGSQFFLVYKDSSLPASYTPFGTIVSGLNIIQNVAKAGTNNANGQGDGAPNEKVEISSVTVKKA
jgi:peptidyl-prolyl cis-trans isomerase B (cyclophilin B)